MMAPIVSPPNEPPPPPPPSPLPPRRPWVWLLPAVLAAALYAHTLGGTFIYDDRFHAQTDRRLHDPDGWRQYLTEGYVPGGVDHLWRPLVSFSFLLQRETTGDRAWPMHLVNVLLHAIAAALVAQFARRLAADDRVGLVAGLLFAAHPVHVEGVAYLVGRADVLCTIGTLGALTLMLRPLTKPRALAVFGCTALAVLSKEPGLLVPPMLVAVWLLRRARGLTPSSGERAAGRLLALLLLFAVSAYVVYREHILPWYWETNLLDYATQPMMHSGPRDRALIPIALFGRAVVLLAVPLKLSIEYGLALITSHQAMNDPYLYAGTIALLAAVGGTITAWRRRAWTVLFLLFCAGLTYFMISNLKIIGVAFAERLLYLPSAFVLILLSMALTRLPRGAGVTIVALLVLGWGIRTTTYAARWSDRLTFYERSLADQPRSARLHVLLAIELIDRGEIERARRVIDDGLAVAPDYWKLWMLAARVAVEQGRFTVVQPMIDRAWELDPFPGDMVFVEDLFASRRERAKRTTNPTTQP